MKVIYEKEGLVRFGEALTTLKLGTIDSPMSALGQGLGLFSKLVEEKTKGEVKVNVGYSSAFGGWAALLSSVEMGSVDMMVEDIGGWEFFRPGSPDHPLRVRLPGLRSLSEIPEQPNS